VGERARLPARAAQACAVSACAIAICRAGAGARQCRLLRDANPCSSGSALLPLVHVLTQVAHVLVNTMRPLKRILREQQVCLR